MKGTPTKTGKQQRDKVLVDGPWIAEPLALAASRLMASLSPVACKLFVVFKAQLRPYGVGNGRLDAHPDRLHANGFTSKASAQAAIEELIDKRLLVRTKQGRKGSMALYGLTPWPMNCKLDELEVGPSAWSIADWRAVPDAALPMSPANPAVWTRPRSTAAPAAAAAAATKRERSPRGGGESHECSPAAGANPASAPPCSPATGVHPKESSTNAPPPGDSPSREPSVGSATAPSAAPAMRPIAGRRLSLMLVQRTRHCKHTTNPAHVAAVAALVAQRMPPKPVKRPAFIVPDSLRAIAQTPPATANDTTNAMQPASKEAA